MPVPQYQTLGPITINNPTEDDFTAVRSAVLNGHCRYVVFCHENHQREGHTYHLQLFASAFKKLSLAAWHKVLGTRFSTGPRPSPDNIPAAIQYCKGFQDGERKEGSGEVEEFGSYEGGKRNDLLAVKRLLDEGHNAMDIAEDPEHFTTVSRCHRFFKEYSNHIKRRKVVQSRTMPKVYIRYGAPGTGKSKWVDDEFGVGNWYGMRAGASGQYKYLGDHHDERVLVYNDVKNGKIPSLGDFLELTDRYPIEYEYKGGFKWFKPEAIVLTSNDPWDCWWDGVSSTDLAAIKRRIFRIERVYTDRTVVEYQRPEDGLQEEG